MLLHDVSLSALAGAVLALGLVVLLEVYTVARLRRSLDLNLGRVFEQLEMLRAESRQLIDAHTQAASSAAPAAPPARPTLVECQALERPLNDKAPLERDMPEPPLLEASPVPAPVSDAYSSAAKLAASGVSPEDIAARSGLPAGEARLLVSLAAARARRDQTARAQREQTSSLAG
ncbi:MAG: DUF2802 domain-containing protein [Steroidobacteraceae bacterium]